MQFLGYSVSYDIPRFLATNNLNGVGVELGGFTRKHLSAVIVSKTV
jgi:hypothetical protein